jgi:hypothetical protein
MTLEFVFTIRIHLAAEHCPPQLQHRQVYPPKLKRRGEFSALSFLSTANFFTDDAKSQYPKPDPGAFFHFVFKISA